MRRPVGKIADRPRWIRGVWNGLEWCAHWQGRWLGMSPVEWLKRIPGGGVRHLTADELGETVPSLPSVAAGGGALTGVTKSTMLQKCPELQSWLCDPSYPDGKPIGATQLTIRRRGASIFVQLKIADQGGLKVEAAEPTIDRALAALEAFLTAGTVPWQTDAYPLDAGQKKRR